MQRYISPRFLLVVCLALLPVYSLAATDVLTMMIFPRRDAATTTKLFTPMAEYLSQQLNMPVKLVTTANFKEFMSAIEMGDVDLVHLNQYQYIQLSKQKAYQVIAQNEEFGRRDMAGAIYARKDSGIQALQQLKGKTVIFGGDQTAMIGYIVPTYLMRRSGLMPGEYQERNAISPPNSVIAMMLGHADAVGAGDVAPELPIIKSRINVDHMKKIAESERLAHLPWAVTSSMPEELRNKIKHTLIQLKNTEQGKQVLKKARLTAINPAVDSDYDKHRKIINSVFKVD